MTSVLTAGQTPNIVLILADDLGWKDLECYGNEFFKTPNIDQLAEEGLRFTNAYAPAPICSASRAATLTGRTTARNGFEFVTKNEPGIQPVNAPLRAPPFTLNLDLKLLTIPEVMRHAEYQTAFFGKWHLNQHHQRYLGWSPTHGPKSHGFEIAEEDFGAHPYSYWNKKKERTFLDLPDGQVPKDTMNERAVSFIESEHQTPFFLMVSHFHVHTPIHTRAKWLYQKTLKRIPEDHSRREDLAHYGSMVATLDHLVGDVVKAIDDAEIGEDTLVVFTSDNGGHPNYAGNTPLRGSKWNLYEGGIRVPFIARWPETIPAGKESHTPVVGTDLLPTFAEIADLPAPEGTDGKSILPILKAPETEIDLRPLVWHFPYYHPESGFQEAPEEIGINDGLTSKTRPHSALREGPWKLIHFYESGRDELYHLEEDISESEDRAQSDPEITQGLRKKLNRYLNSVQARLPIANPDYSE